MNIVTILLIVNVFAAIGIIALVLMQQSKGDMGSAFGGGGSQSMFGSRGSSNFLSRSTSTLVTVFFISSLALAYTYAKRNQVDEQMGTVPVQQSSEVPSVDDSGLDTPINDSVPSVDEGSVPSIEGSVEPSAVESSVPDVGKAAEAIESSIPNSEDIEAAIDQAVEAAEEEVLPSTQ